MAHRTHDPRILRAISHPVRNRILNELYAAGPSRAADLAADLGIPANQASFHLRQLAKYGLIEPAPEAARDGRDRVWKVVHPEGLDLEMRELEGDRGAAATAVFRRNAADFAHLVVDRAFSDQREEGTFNSVGEHALRLTKDEAKQVADELIEVVDRWTRRTAGRSPDRRTYLVMHLTQPYPEVD